MKVLALNNITKVEAKGAYTPDQAVIDDGEMAINDTLNLKVKITPTANQSNAENAKWTITSGSRYVEYTSNNVNEDDSTIAKGEMVTLKAKKAGIFSVKVELGGKSDELTMTIAKNSSAITIKEIPTRTLRATVRTGTVDEIVAQMNSNDLYNSIPATATDAGGDYTVQVPVKWYDAQITSKTSATVSGYAVTSREGDENTYKYQATAIRILQRQSR